MDTPYSPQAWECVPLPHLRASTANRARHTLPSMNETNGIDEFIRDLMPEASEEERKIAAESLNGYILILMRIAERMEKQERTEIRQNPNKEV